MNRPTQFQYPIQPRAPQGPKAPMDTRPLVFFYTDGSASVQTRDGGWAVIIKDERGNRRSFGGYVGDTTSNQMELTAVYEAVKRLKKPCRIQLVTDSQNLIGWLWGWDTLNRRVSRAHSFRASNPIRAHVDQINNTLVRVGHVLVEPVWVRGHDGHPENEEADRLAERCRSQKIREYIG